MEGGSIMTVFALPLVKSFLEKQKNQDLLNESRFDDLYMNFLDQYPNLSTDALTRILLKAKIDPLPYQYFIYAGQYMNRVVETRSFTIPKSIRLISHHAFANNPLMHELIFEEGVDLIERNAFADNCSLTEIHFPKSLTIVHQRAFANCGRLTNVYIDENTQLLDGVFDDCVSLSNIYFSGTLDQWNFLLNNRCLYHVNKRSNIKIHCSDHTFVRRAKSNET